MPSVSALPLREYDRRFAAFYAPAQRSLPLLQVDPVLTHCKGAARKRDSKKLQGALQA